MKIRLSLNTSRLNSGNRTASKNSPAVIVNWSRNVVALLLAGVLVVLGACSNSEPSTDGGEAQFRRLTEAQYRNTVADIFGRSIVIGGRFDPLERIDGLLAIGASNATITPAGLERYDAIARSIALQVVDDYNRDLLIPCNPVNIAASDDACAAEFLTTVGHFLFRRRLTETERGMYVDIAADASDQLGDFYEGLAYSLAGMLVSPKFLFISETPEPDPDYPGKYRLDGYSKAARLSFLLWNTTPDAALLDAAESNELASAAGLEAQFERMMASPRAKVGVRAFFEDMLEFERFETMEKDPLIYPVASMRLVADAREQTLRTITHHLLDDALDYRDIFTSRRTFVSGALGLVYRVPVNNPSGWVAYEFPEDAPWAGIHTQMSFQAIFSHPGKSSPTLRGKAVRELLLCQKVPDPPGNVDFSDFNDDAHAVNKTARQRLGVHNAEPTCAGCHKIMDPIGLAMEQFDGLGQFRTTENGTIIDTSGELDGVPFDDAISLGQAIRDNPATPACMLNRLYAYAVGRAPASSEREWMAFLKNEFAQTNYQLKGLLRQIVLSSAFYRVAPPQA
jgi:hypothetical protein